MPVADRFLPACCCIDGIQGESDFDELFAVGSHGVPINGALGLLGEGLGVELTNFPFRRGVDLLGVKPPPIQEVFFNPEVSGKPIREVVVVVPQGQEQGSDLTLPGPGLEHDPCFGVFDGRGWGHGVADTLVRGGVVRPRFQVSS